MLVIGIIFAYSVANKFTMLSKCESRSGCRVPATAKLLKILIPDFRAELFVPVGLCLNMVLLGGCYMLCFVNKNIYI